MLEPDWQNKQRKHRHATLAEEDRDNTANWRIDNREKLLIEMDKDPNGVLIMILDMRNIYTKYLNQANHANKQCEKNPNHCSRVRARTPDQQQQKTRSNNFT